MPTVCPGHCMARCTLSPSLFSLSLLILSHTFTFAHPSFLAWSSCCDFWFWSVLCWCWPRAHMGKSNDEILCCRPRGLTLSSWSTLKPHFCCGFLWFSFSFCSFVGLLELAFLILKKKVQCHLCRSKTVNAFYQVIFRKKILNTFSPLKMFWLLPFLYVLLTYTPSLQLLMYPLLVFQVPSVFCVLCYTQDLHGDINS